MYFVNIDAIKIQMHESKTYFEVSELVRPAKISLCLDMCVAPYAPGSLAVFIVPCALTTMVGSWG